ncbi:MAG TPA: ABC transporter permease, partial [Cyclobacteriaceae bacterium]|nr:ABC transporter permease [Cyclobacteriaceae bacterium]
KVAFRQFYKLPVFSAINIVGLVIGLSSSILIGLWVFDELTWDSYHENRKNIYRVYLNRVDGNSIIDTQMAACLPLWEEFKKNQPGIEYVTPSNWFGWDVQYTYKETKIEKLTYYFDADFLKMFTVRFLKGSIGALNDPRSVILTESTAKELFGNEEPIGKTIKVGATGNEFITVTAVVADPPANSTITFEAIMPFNYYVMVDDWAKSNLDNWNNMSFNFYVSFREDADPAAIEERVKGVIQRHVPDFNTKFEVTFLPMPRWHLYDRWENGKSVAGQLTYVKIFGAVGLFVLFIACINFMNLSTARSERRAKEVGIRKSIGSARNQLVVQFLGETFLMSIAAFILSIIVVQAVLPVFNALIAKDLRLDFSNGIFWAAGISIVVLTSVVAGAYPAFYLSSFRPAEVLKGKISSGRSGFFMRRVLVTGQFLFSIVLIVATILVYQQMNFLKDRDTGYDRNNLILVWVGHVGNHYEAFKNEILQKGYATNVTRAGSPITDINSMTEEIYWPGKREDQKDYLAIVETDYDYCKTAAMTIMEGRDFSREFADTSSVILNEAAVKYMELEDPVGTTLRSDDDVYKVVGVVKNVVMIDPERAVVPTCYFLTTRTNIAESMIRLPEGRETAAIEGIGEVFKQFAPEAIFNPRFADVEYGKKFEEIERIGKFTNIFAFMAIFVSCLGLFGLAAFTAERRTKEIGIRKVLGASVTNLVGLLSKEFAMLVLIAFAIAGPLSIWQANRILQQYSYHVNIQWWVLPVTGLVALLLAVIAVGTQAFRAATSNPVDSLKTE